MICSLENGKQKENKMVLGLKILSVQIERLKKLYNLFLLIIAYATDIIEFPVFQ